MIGFYFLACSSNNNNTTNAIDAIVSIYITTYLYQKIGYAYRNAVCISQICAQIWAINFESTKVSEVSLRLFDFACVCVCVSKCVDGVFIELSVSEHIIQSGNL